MNKKIIAYIIVGILILAILGMTFFPGLTHAFRDSKISGNSVEDKCNPAPGYTEESWIEHMNHHPNIYKECLD